MSSKPPDILNPAYFARSMLEADRFARIAQVIEALARFRMPSAQVALWWTLRTGPVAAADLLCAPRGAREWANPAHAAQALATDADSQTAADAEGRSLRSEILDVMGAGQAVVQSRMTPVEFERLDEDPARPEGMLLLGRRVSGLLEARRLRASVRRLERSERVQRALYAIADLAGSDLREHEVLGQMHRIVGELIAARNFLIVRYDPERRTLRFAYAANSDARQAPDPNQELPEDRFPNSLTVALLRGGRPLMGQAIALRRRLGLQADTNTDADRVAWLGVPMRSNGEVRGAVVVRSDEASARYRPSDRALLEYVAQHIQAALTRRQAREELERQVARRTEELGRTNRELVAEVRERQAGERLQTALFRIAELTNAGIGMGAFYSAVHAEIAQLLYARNLFVALLVGDGSEFDFPYAVDECDDPAIAFRRRPLRRGLTEYVLRSGKPLLLDQAAYERLLAAGEVERIGSLAVGWLGVPLVMNGHVVGVLVVQSYTEGISYGPREQEVLAFVAQNIAAALQRRQAAESLKSANAELEAQIEELHRTQAELIENEKMASLGRLVAGVAHEINTPLGIGVTAASHLDEMFKDIERAQGEAAPSAARKTLDSARRCVQLILNNLGKAAQLVRSFKQVAVDQSDEMPRRVAMRVFLDDVLASLHPRLKPTPHRVEVDCAAQIELDTLPGALYQIVSNIVLNALVHAFDDAHPGLIRIGVSAVGDDMEMTIADDGKGMSEDVRQRVFEPFYTTRRGSGGTGLGLHLVYNLVTQLLGGTIACASEPDQGARFTIRLPSATGAAAGSDPAAAVKE